MNTKPLIAVVDDDPSILRALSRLIRSRGYGAELFTSAKDFLEQAGTLDPACVILDVQMPGMSGLDLHTRLRERGNRIPVIFITAHEDPIAETQAARTGAAGFFYKPFRNEALWNAVHTAMGGAWDPQI